MSTLQDRPSGIPRPSRLPRPITIPQPPTPSSSTSSLRPMSSRESLSAGIASTRDQFSPHPRSSASRNSIHSVSGAKEVKPFVRHCACKDQLRPGVPKVHSCSKPTAAPKPTRNTTASRRWSTITQNPTQQYKPWAEPLPGDPDGDDYIRQQSPSADIHESLLASYLNGTLGNSAIADNGGLLSPVSDCFLPGLDETSLKRAAGLSLSERTIETLSRLPSSPTGSRKSSAFYYDDSRRNSVADDTASSRPDSSYFSELSSGLVSPVATRAPVARSRHSMVSPRLSSPMSEASETSFHLPVRRSCGTLHGSACSRPAPKKKVIKGVSIRPPRDLSISTIITTSESEPSGPPSAGWDGTIRPAGAFPAASDGTDQPEFRKSSSALRDHIAKAKAAKRAALKQAGGDSISSIGLETLVMLSATGFDGSPLDESFNYNRMGGNKILKQRVSDARTSGRLNIAALCLKEVPGEVMKMYDFETIQASGGTWSDSVDLKRFIAPDNELEKLDDVMFPDHDPTTSDENADGDAPAAIFGGLETMDLHGNQIVSVPVGLRRLAHLTSLNVSSNRLANDCLGVITQIPSLRDLKLAQNCLAGPLDASLADLTLLETLDVHGNHVSALPSEIERLTRLRILNLSENNFEAIAFESLAKLPLIDLDLKRNKLSGTLIKDPIGFLSQLQTLDVSSNRLTRLVPEGVSLALPVLHTLLLSMNRLQELPDMSTWTNLLTLTADTNNISTIPESFSRLSKLRQADLSSNEIKVIPPEVSLMEDLTLLRLTGNPLREKRFSSAPADAIKAMLAARMEASRVEEEAAPVVASPAEDADRPASDAGENDASGEDRGFDEEEQEEQEQFPTPPTSALPSPNEAKDFSSMEPSWQVKAGGLLDHSRSESATLDAEHCAKIAGEHKVLHAQLHHNLYVYIPGALSVFAETLTTLALGHNQMAGETYLAEELELPSLSELNLTSNHITSLGPLTKFLRAPLLQKIDISMNRLSALPPDLKHNFPKMIVLLASNNQLVELDPASIKGLQVVDVSSNDIAHLDPRIGLLWGGQSGLQKLEVMGNRFRVPRWNILESGTEATMSWLRGRVSAAEMAAWKAENGDEDCRAVEDELD